MNDDPKESKKGLNNWQKTLIAFSPVIIGYLLIFGMMNSSHGQVTMTYSICVLLPIGIILAGGFVVQGLKKRNPPPHLSLLVLVFVLVSVAYTIISFAGCFLIAISVN